MPKPCGGTSFSQKTFPRLDVSRYASVDDLECHGVTQNRVEGFVSDAHGPATELKRRSIFAGDDLVMFKPQLEG